MQAISLDLRQRILDACDAGEETRQETADRFAVSLGLVKKLLAQRKARGHIQPLPRPGRTPKITPALRQRLAELVAEQPDRTLAELRAALGVECTLGAIHYNLAKLGLTYKKRPSGPPSRTARTSRKSARTGRWTCPPSTRGASFSSMNPARKRT